MKPDEMWSLYQTVNPDAKEYEAWAFCNGGEVGDKLANLVLEGKKTATSSAFISFETENEPVPKPGNYVVIIYDNGDAACVIRDTRISLVPFDEVCERHAFLEGEGDRSLSYWREVHREAFSPDYEAVGREFDEKGICVLEEFEVVFR